MKIEVIVRSVHDTRPSGHKPTALFAGGISDKPYHYKETIWCPHVKEHAALFMKVFDLSAELCGIQKGEFKDDPHFKDRWEKIVKDIEELHVYVVSHQGKAKTKRLEEWIRKK
jgi:hypothetical protein